MVPEDSCQAKNYICDSADSHVSVAYRNNGLLEWTTCKVEDYKP